jgi:hypothetical protein
MRITYNSILWRLTANRTGATRVKRAKTASTEAGPKTAILPAGVRVPPVAIDLSTARRAAALGNFTGGADYA